MYRIISKKQVYFIGKVSDLLEVLEDLASTYPTVQAYIDAQLEVR